MPTQTTNYGLYKPLVNDATDQDLWGGYLNTNMDTLDTTIKAVSDAASGGLPRGAMVYWTTTTVPTGFLECNGAAVSRTTYANLFAVIGTTFGTGDGSTTFNLPDCRGQFLRGWDHGAGVDPARGFASTQADAYGSHTHTANVTDNGHIHPVGDNGGYGAAGGGPQGFVQNNGGTQVSARTATTGITVANVASGDTETRPKNIAVLVIIKYI